MRKKSQEKAAHRRAKEARRAEIESQRIALARAAMDAREDYNRSLERFARYVLGEADPVSGKES